MADTIPGNISSIVSLSANSSSSSAIDFYGDSDWWRVSLTAGQTYVFELKGWDSFSGTLDDPLLELYSGSGLIIDWDDDSGLGSESRITFTPTSSGFYFLGAE